MRVLSLLVRSLLSRFVSFVSFHSFFHTFSFRDQLAITKETGRYLGLGDHIYIAQGWSRARRKAPHSRRDDRGQAFPGTCTFRHLCFSSSFTLRDADSRCSFQGLGNVCAITGMVLTMRRSSFCITTTLTPAPSYPGAHYTHIPIPSRSTHLWNLRCVGEGLNRK